MKLRMIQEYLQCENANQTEENEIGDIQRRIDKINKLNDDIEQEFTDTIEQIQDKISGRSKKKRESYQRLEAAEKLYTEDLFLMECYVKVFCNMKGLIFMK